LADTLTPGQLPPAVDGRLTPMTDWLCCRMAMRRVIRTQLLYQQESWRGACARNIKCQSCSSVVPGGVEGEQWRMGVAAAIPGAAVALEK